MKTLSLVILLILSSCSTGNKRSIEVYKGSHLDEGIIRKQGKLDFIPAKDERFSGFYCVSESDLKYIIEQLNKK